MEYIERRGGYCLRLNTGAVMAEYQGRKRFIRFAEPGAPDAIAIISGGVLFLETKTETGKQSPEQVVWQQEVERRGGRYLLLRPSNYVELLDGALGAVE